MSKNPDRNVRRTHRVFFEAHGEVGPWECFDCREDVLQMGRGTWDGNIHHRDNDVTNDTPENLVMMHAVCHQHLHGPPTAEQRASISTKLRGQVSPTKGMKFPNHWTKTDPNRIREQNQTRQPAVRRRPLGARTNVHGENNPFFGKSHSSESLAKMRTPRLRIICPDCGKEYAKNWLTRHKKEGMCIELST